MKSLDELKQLSIAVFKANPKADVLLATSDGQFFLETNKNAAEFHAKKKGGLKIHTIDREDKSESNEDAKLTAEERIEKIQAMTSVEDVIAALVDEKAKTVKTAGTEKIEALKAASEK